MAFCVLLAVTIALLRRWTGIVPRLRPRSVDAEIILYFIGGLYITFFLFVGSARLFEMNAEHVWAVTPWQPFSSIVALGLRTLPLGFVEWMHAIMWWAHVAIFLGFGCYIPLSKHMHLVFAGPNTYLFRKGAYGWRHDHIAPESKAKPPAERPRAMGLPPKIDFETAEKYGVDRIQEYSYKTLLDGFACTECGRCNAACPAHLTLKPLKPKKVLHDQKVNLLKNNGPQLLKFRDLFGRPIEANKEAEAAYEPVKALITKEEIDRAKPGAVREDGMYMEVDGQIHVDEAWACTTCGACVEVCPVLIDSVPGSLIGIRQNLVMMETDFPHELTAAFKGMERQGNPWGVGQDKRQDWAENLDVPVMADIAAENPERVVEYLFWVGCAGATDDRAKKVQQALVRVLKAANVDFAILGCEEKCTGDPARRMGNEAVFNALAQENVATLAQYKFKKIFTTCPHCFNSLKNEYGEFGVDYTVQHHTEIIEALLKDKRIPLDTKKQLNEHVTFHDPCYLGRYNKVYDEPRAVLLQIGVKNTEMERTKQKSFCCGAGGARMWMEEPIGKRVNVERTEQAMATGAETIVVGCPFCMTMMTDGTKAKEVEETVKVKDLAELIAERLVTASALPGLPAPAAE